MQAGMTDVYSLINIVTQYYTVNAIDCSGKNCIFNNFVYDVLNYYPNIISPYTGTDSCGTASSQSNIFPDRNATSATYDQLINIGMAANGYYAQAMLNICISNETFCDIGKNIQTQQQYDDALNIVITALNTNYINAINILTAPYNAVTMFCITPIGYEASLLYQKTWISSYYVSGVQYWQNTLDDITQNMLNSQANISSIIPPNLDAIEALIMIGIFYNSTSCSPSYFTTLNSTQPISYPPDNSCNVINQYTVDNILSEFNGCMITAEFSENTLSMIALANSPQNLTNYYGNSFVQLLNACQALDDSPCSLDPVPQNAFEDAVANAELSGVLDLVDVGIQTVCAIGTQAYQLYNTQQTCCLYNCTSSTYCSNLQGQTLDPFYASGCYQIQNASVVTVTNTPIVPTMTISANDICIMQAGMADVYSLANIISSYYTNVLVDCSGSNCLFNTNAYDVSNGNTNAAISAYTGTGSCGTANSAGIFGSMELPHATYEQLINAGSTVYSYYAQAMLNICISNETSCEIGNNIQTEEQYDEALNNIVAYLNVSYVNSMTSATAQYNAVDNFCINSVGYEISTLYQTEWLSAFEVFTLHFWDSIINSTVKDAFTAQANISSVIPPILGSVEALIMMGVFYNSTACDSSYFFGGFPTPTTSNTDALKLYKASYSRSERMKLAATTVADSGCESANENAIDYVDIALGACSLIAGFANKVNSGLALAKAGASLGKGLTNFGLNTVAQIFGACTVLPKGPCSFVNPYIQLGLDAGLTAAGIALLGPELGYVDIGLIALTAACDLGTIAHDVYKNQISCCSTTCNSLLCQLLQSVCLQTPYYGPCK